MRCFKVIGVGVLLCCGILAGLLSVAYQRKKYAQAMGFLSLLRQIRLEIDCFSMPVSRILSRCDPRILADCGVRQPPADFSQLLREARLFLPEEICRLLTEFSGQLGGSYREEQLRCCDYYLARLAPYCDSLREELPKREKTAFFLPVALSAILLLLLL